MNEEEYRKYLEVAWGLAWPMMDKMADLARCFSLAGKLAPPPDILINQFGEGRIQGHVTWRADGPNGHHAFAFDGPADLSDILYILLDYQRKIDGER